MLKITLSQKQQLQEEYKRWRTPVRTQSRQPWGESAKKTFRRDRLLGQSSISRIVSDGSQPLRDGRPIALTAKRKPTAVAPELENELFKWIFARNKNGVALNGEPAIMKAEKLLTLANAQHPDKGIIFLEFSSGCIVRIRKRHGIRFCRVNGEERGAACDAFKEHMP